MVHLYSLSLQKSTAITQAVYGNFSHPKAQEVVISRGKVLELHRSEEGNKLQCVLSIDVFGLIRSLAVFRLVGASRDYIVVASDSGRIVVLEYVPEKNLFEKVHQETFGKTGVRRIVPGEYVAVDPKGRAVMIAAVEKQKFVYVLNRDSGNRLTISSALEAHKSYTVVHAMCALDVGFENPIFACLEVNYEELDRNPEAEPKKVLTLYEMDLGLNHVTRKTADVVDMSAHAVIPIPGGNDGPSGILVCCENFMVYKRPDHPDVVCAIPRRLEMGRNKGLMIVSHATHKLKDFFFLLIQSEYGDIYKVTLSHKEEEVEEIQCKYFDSIPVCNSIAVFKTVFLFAASEFANHALYQFQGIGTDEEDPVCTSSHPHGKDAIVAFKPRALKNLSLFQDIISFAPITDLKVLDATCENTPQIYTVCGRGPRSSMRILRHGLAITEMAYNDLPGKPMAVWTVKENQKSEYDRYIVVSFIDVTLVLSIGDTVEEVVDTGFLNDTPSLLVTLLADDSYAQVHPDGIRHLLPNRTNEWKAPGLKKVQHASANEKQIVVSLTGGEVVYFEIDESHTLSEIAKVDLGCEVACLSVQPVPAGRARASFLAVGAQDNTVRMLTLERDRCMKQVALQALPPSAVPESVCILNVPVMGQGGENTTVFLSIGLSNGILLRAVVDSVTGALSDQRSRFLGARAVKLHRTTVQKNPAMLALSAQPWLCYSFQGKFTSTPMSYDSLDYASSFASEQCPEGFVAVSSNTLRIITYDRLGEVFNQVVIPLSFTPRKFVPLPLPLALQNDPEHQNEAKTTMLAVVEADHNSYDEATKRAIRSELKKIVLSQKEEEEGKLKPEDQEREEDPEEDQIGTFKAGEGQWGSCWRIVDPFEKRTLEKIDMDVDEAALSVSACHFEGHQDPFIIVGTTTGMTLRPRKVAKASIKVYSYNSTYQPTLLHSTEVEDYPICFASYRGKLLVGIGHKIRMYSLGKKKLLRKCEYKNLPNAVVWLRVHGSRIYCADVQESVHVLKYKEQQNNFVVLCDDYVSRYVTCGDLLDAHTVIAGDKFDSLFVCRVPQEAKQDEAGDGSGTALKLKGDTAYLTGTCHKLDHVAQFHVGEGVTGIQKVALGSGTAEIVLYSTVMGGIGALYPFTTREEVDFFMHLEMAMRNEKPPLCGRDHIMFRSYYFPVQCVIDGDLCEQYSSLHPSVQRSIANELDKTPAEIQKKLEDVRNRVL